MTRRSYTPEQRDAAQAAYVQHGLAGAARETGIPKGTVNAWARAGRWRTDAGDAARARARTERARQAWAEITEESRAQLAARLQSEVHAVLDTLQGPVLQRQVVTLAGGTGERARAEVVDVVLPAPTGRDLRDRAQAATLLIDRMRQLTENATGDVDDDLELMAEYETYVARDAELRHLRAVVDGAAS